MRIRSLYLRTKWRLKEFISHKYTGGGIDQIQKLAPHDAVYRIFDYVHERIEYSKDACDWDTRQLNEHEKAFWYAWDVDCEITNGGFNQYFFNKLTRPIEPIVAAYELIGALEHRKVFLAASSRPTRTLRLRHGTSYNGTAACNK